MNMPLRPGAANITLKAMARLPARLRGGNAITVVTQGIDYLINVDIEKLPPAPVGSNAGKFTLVWDYNTNTYQRVEFTALPAPIVDWSLITGKPTEFPPEDHTHPIDDVTGLQTALDSKIGEAPNDGGYYFRHSLGWSAFVDAPADNQNYARRNNAWNLISGGGGIPDAPVDGVLYGRKNAAWTASVEDAPHDGTAYNRKDGAWTATGGLAEAPNDGKQYSRMSLGWHDLTTDLNAKQSTSEKGNANGYASLDSGGKLPVAQLPPLPAGSVGSSQITDGSVTGGDLATNTVLYGNMASTAIATAAEYRSAATQKLLAADNTWSAAAFVALTMGATVTPDFSTGINFSLQVATSNFTLANPTNQKAGQSGVIEITQDTSTPRTISFGSNWKFPGGTAPSLTTTASRVDLLYYVVKASGTIHANLVKDSR